MEFHLQVDNCVLALLERVPDDDRRVLRIPGVPQQQKHEGVGHRLGRTHPKLLQNQTELIIFF